MLPRIAKFEKVSYIQYGASCSFTGCEHLAELEYDRLLLPTRATAGSAGYDFYSTCEFTLEPGESIIVPSGIRCSIAPGWALFMLPKSGLGFKFRLQLDNTIGLVDQDYYFSDNEGHIMIKVTNDSKDGKVVRIKKGDKLCQGVFLPYGITIDDRADGVRNGGFGSTGH